MSFISDEHAWELARGFIAGHIDACKKRESKEAFEYLGLDPHLQNCLVWLQRLDDTPAPAVQISTFGHDLDRALVDRVRREEFLIAEEYKRVHAAHSAKVLCDFLSKNRANPRLIGDVAYLVRNHDTPSVWVGKTADQTVGLVLVKSADALSFFDVNFDSYLRTREIFDVHGKMDMMYTKMCGRTYEQMEAGLPRRLDPGIQPQVRDKVEEIQCRAEELVKENYAKALRKIEEASRPYDPRKGDTRSIDLKDLKLKAPGTEYKPDQGKKGETTSS